MQKGIQRECQCEFEFNTAFNISPAPQPGVERTTQVGCLPNIPWCPILLKKIDMQTHATRLGKQGYFKAIIALAAYTDKTERAEE
mmetsp:Transcript_132405/g.229645  ORF Transcript_132405/g.229645 Transcript_132405/m.229645 type:complete len:85 (-) Transcript_132405:1341-1595(-)